MPAPVVEITHINQESIDPDNSIDNPHYVGLEGEIQFDGTAENVTEEDTMNYKVDGGESQEMTATENWTLLLPNSDPPAGIPDNNTDLHSVTFTALNSEGSDYKTAYVRRRRPEHQTGAAK